MPGNKKLFLSAVSSEFNSCRTLLAGDLKRPSREGSGDAKYNAT